MLLVIRSKGGEASVYPTLLPHGHDTSQLCGMPGIPQPVLLSTIPPSLPTLSLPSSSLSFPSPHLRSVRS